MNKTEFLTIFGTFEKIEIVKKTLPSIIDETQRNNAKLIVHDSSVEQRQEKWDYLLDLNKNNDFFLILSSNMSMAHARNMCLHLGQELYSPDYICMMEDDHGYNPGYIQNMINAIKTYHGKKAPNELVFGLFTGCGEHHTKEREILYDGNSYPKENVPPNQLGRANSCCRCATTGHWNNVLKGYDTDEYFISPFQTKNLNIRNYNKGYTVMYVQNGKFCFNIKTDGRGSSNKSLKLWDYNYTASDNRSHYKGKMD
jgi:hypothetical protein